MATVKKTYYESGELESERFELNGKKEGKEKWYHRNGQIQMICTYVDGILHGEYILYDAESGHGELFNYMNGIFVNI
jgi:antitoxin component YwqK of YwqJK toxin-antitoxin module